MSEETPTEGEHPVLRLRYGFGATRPPDKLDVWVAGDDDHIIPSRQVRHDRPIETDTTPAQIRGEALHTVL